MGIEVAGNAPPMPIHMPVAARGKGAYTASSSIKMPYAHARVIRQPMPSFSARVRYRGWPWCRWRRSVPRVRKMGFSRFMRLPSHARLAREVGLVCTESKCSPEDAPAESRRFAYVTFLPMVENVADNAGSVPSLSLAGNHSSHKIHL